MAATTDAVLAFLLAAEIAWLLVPYAERLAFRIGAVLKPKARGLHDRALARLPFRIVAIDMPKERALHDRPMPRLSGLAIFAGIEVAGWIWLPSDDESRSILIGAGAVHGGGGVDDVGGPPGLP